MRRTGLVLLAAGLFTAGCSDFRDLFTSHAETAARVDSRELPSARVADLLKRFVHRRMQAGRP